MSIFNKKDKEEAKLISAWIIKEDEDGWAWVTISNQSRFPIYKIILSTVNIQLKPTSGLETPNEIAASLSVVPPGKYFTRIQIHHGMGFISGIELAFQDSHGKNWIRNGVGITRKLNLSPSEYYSLPLPLSWEKPLEKIS